MLQQILNDMHIEPELLAELDEEQKQLLFCKMREEQVRKWKLSELANQKDLPKKIKQDGKKVSFKLGLDGEPIVSVMGFGSDSDVVETLLEEKAKQQAELEADALRVAAEEELDKLVHLSRNTVVQMEIASTTQKLDPTREAVVKSLQEATQELEEKMRSETENRLQSDTPNISQNNDKNQDIKLTNIIKNGPKIHSNGEKPVISVKPYISKGNSQTSNKVPYLNPPKNITCPNIKQETVSNREKLKDATENTVPSVPLYLASETSAYSSSGSASMVTIRSMISNPISDFPLRKKSSEKLALGVAAHVKQFERLSNSSLEALKTATLERAKKRRQREILDHLHHMADMAKITDPEEVAWRQQELRAKNAEKKIREIARRAREEHRRVASGSDGPLSVTNKSSEIKIPNESRNQDINGNTKLNLENVGGQMEAKRTLSIQNSDASIEGLATSSKPSSRQAIIDWFRMQELPKGSGLDCKRQHVAEWFHGIISRNEAEEILLNSDVGSYLVRVSERIWGYVVSYRSSERCRHYLIDITDGNYAFLGSYKNTHSSLCDLIAYHRTNAVTTSGDEAELLLKPSCQKPSKKVYEELFSGTAYKCIPR